MIRRSRSDVLLCLKLCQYGLEATANFVEAGPTGRLLTPAVTHERGIRRCGVRVGDGGSHAIADDIDNNL